MRMTSYPLNNVACDLASRYLRCSRSAVTFTASAPATRVTGSMLMSFMWPLAAMSRWMSASRSASVLPTCGFVTVTEYGSGMPPFRDALPDSSNSMGRFLKHIP
jgi:hypothetical protein